MVGAFAISVASVDPAVVIQTASEVKAAVEKSARTDPVAFTNSVRQTLIVQLIKHVVVHSAVTKTVVSADGVRLTLTAPSINHVVRINAFKEKVASVKNASWTKTVPTVSGAAKTLAKKATVRFRQLICHTFLCRRLELPYF